MVAGVLDTASQSLALTPSLRRGLTAITVLSAISLSAASIIFLYLAYKLIAWAVISRRDVEEHESNPKSFQRAVDFALGIDGIFSQNVKLQEPAALDKAGNPLPRRKNPPNQFLILIFNLLLADIHQGLAFFFNFLWLRRDAIVVESPICFAQGLFVSTGDLASSTFITMIAIHTYLSVVRSKRIPQKALYLAIVFAWMFVYLISMIPIAATRNGRDHGGFFVRAGAWCWMNENYENLRLSTHYLFIFIGLATTAVLYLAIFLFLRRQSQIMHKEPADERTASQLQLSHNPAFLIYPIIYVLCTLPLALGRIATMAGATVPLGYFCFAGAMIASNGSFDCLLFGTTRNVIVFASKYDVDRADVGLNTFAFMKTPGGRRYGNMIWVQGGRIRVQDDTTGGWLTQRSPSKRSRNRRLHGSRTISQESLRGKAIQMDTITTVVVETDDDRSRDIQFPENVASRSLSLTSTDKGYDKVI